MALVNKDGQTVSNVQKDTVVLHQLQQLHTEQKQMTEKLTSIEQLLMKNASQQKHDITTIYNQYANLMKAVDQSHLFKRADDINYAVKNCCEEIQDAKFMLKSGLKTAAVCILIMILCTSFYNHRAIELNTSYDRETAEILRNEASYWMDQNNYQLYLKNTKKDQQ